MPNVTLDKVARVDLVKTHHTLCVRHVEPVDAWDLPVEQRSEFDHHDWAAIERGEASATFFQYRGEWFDLDDYQLVDYPYFGTVPSTMRKEWDAIATDSFFSATVVKYIRDEYGDDWLRVATIHSL